MKIFALPAIASLATCSLVIIGSCREKGEQNSLRTSEQSARRARALHPNSQVSDYQKKRIRSSVDSVAKIGTKGVAIQEFEELLRNFPSDMDFLQELALQASTASIETQKALASAVVQLYRSGDYQNLGQALDALAIDGPEAGMAFYFSEELSGQGDLAVRAYEELLVNPAKKARASQYEDIAWGAARVLGYQEALARIPDIHDGSFGTSAARKLITSWTYNNPEESSSFVRDLPDSEYRNSLVVHMVEKIATSQDFEMAYKWANYLQGNAKDKALGIVKREEAIIQRRAEQRAQREAKK